MAFQSNPNSLWMLQEHKALGQSKKVKRSQGGGGHQVSLGLQCGREKASLRHLTFGTIDKMLTQRHYSL